MPSLQEIGLGMTALTLNNVVRSDLSGVAIDPVFSWVVPGGCHQCRFKLARPVATALLQPDIQYGLDLLITDGAGPIWRGRIDRGFGNLDSSGEYVEVAAVGVAADDQSYDSKTFAAGISVGTAMETVRTDLLWAVGSSNISGGGYVLAANLTLTDRKAADALSDLAALADGVTGIWWGIWASGSPSSSGLQLIVQQRSAYPAYYLPQHFFAGKLGWDGSQYGNRQKIRYAGGASVTFVDDAPEIARLGFTREAPLLTRNDLTNIADAQAAAQVMLNLRKVLRVRSESVRVAAPNAVLDAGRRAVPLWRVWPGNLLAIEGPQPAFVGGYDLSKNALTIVQSEFSVKDHAVTLTFESLDATLTGMLARMWRGLGLG